MSPSTPPVTIQTNHWFDRPMRWAQLVLTEADPLEIEVDFWLDYFRRTRVDGVCLSSGGYIAYHPTQIPLHYRSRHLGGRDVFGELVEGSRQLGLYILARTDPHAVHQPLYEAHPDWIAVDAAGNPRRHWSHPEAWVTCALGPYNLEFMTEVNKELVAMYGIDGIFANRWAGHGICYCEHCQRNFKAASGLDLPRSQELSDPAWRAYLRWRQERLFAVCRLWDAEMRRIQPHSRYIPNSGGGALSTLDMKELSELTPFLFADRQGRRDLMTPWALGKNAKEYRAVYGRKPIGAIFNVGLEARHRWKDAVQNAAELQVWVAEAVANGMRPWFIKFAAKLHDRRWLPVIEDLFTWHQRVENYLRNETPLARVAIVYSQQTAAYYGGPQAQAMVEDPILGVYQALIEARIPFEMVHDQLLTPERLAPFKTLILPNVAALSDAQCQQLRDFVTGGGSLIATLETSLYNEDGQRRADFGLADLFGASCSGSLAGPLQNTYLQVTPGAADGPYAALLRGLESAGRTIGGVYRLPVHPTEPFPDAPLRQVPLYPDLPMEEVYPRAEAKDPAVYLRQLGAGRVAYLPWDLDRTFWEVLDVDHGRLLANLVRWATDEPGPVAVSGPGLLDVTVWRQERSLTVHLVNLTNPMTMRGYYRELLPVGPLQVRLSLPAGQQAGRVQLLKLGQPAQVERTAAGLLVTVPTVVDHEVVAVDLIPI